MVENNRLIHYNEFNIGKYLNVSVNFLRQALGWQNGYCNSLIHCTLRGLRVRFPSLARYYINKKLSFSIS